MTNLIDYEDEVLDRISKERLPRSLDALDSQGETTHLSVVDGEGMAVSATASINAYFGARVAHPELGFLYNDYMHEFEIGREGHPFAIGSAAMPYSSMSPTILTRNGEVRLVLGSPGSARIISAVSEVIQLWVDAGFSVDEAVAYPRIHAGAARELFVEARSEDAEWIEELVEEGFDLQTPVVDLASGGRNPYFGGVHAVGYRNGTWAGAADPRRDGTVGVAASGQAAPRR